eukprot:sb/3467860/
MMRAEQSRGVDRGVSLYVVMGTKENEGDNPTNERLKKSVNDFIVEIMRLDYAGTSEEMNVEPQLVNDNYNHIKQFPESKLTPDSVGAIDKDINTYFRHALKTLSKDEIIDARCKTFLSSVKLLKCAMFSLDEVSTTRKLEEQLMQKVKAYSTVLAQNCAAVSPVVRKSSQDPAPTPLSERDKKLVIFGLPETTDRLTKTSVDGLFTELNETPKRRATLIALLKKSRQLKNSEHYSAVYLSPDLTPIQIKERGLLRISEETQGDESYSFQWQNLCCPVNTGS